MNRCIAFPVSRFSPVVLASWPERRYTCGRCFAFFAWQGHTRQWRKKMKQTNTITLYGTLPAGQQRHDYLFLGHAAFDVLGTKEQFTRAKNLFPLVASVFTPLLTAAIATYIPK